MIIPFTSSFISHSRRNSVGTGKILILAVSMIAVLGLFVPTNSFAIHASEDVSWQLIPVCFLTWLRRSWAGTKVPRGRLFRAPYSALYTSG